MRNDDNDDKCWVWWVFWVPWGPVLRHYLYRKVLVRETLRTERWLVSRICSTYCSCRLYQRGQLLKTAWKIREDRRAKEWKNFWNPQFTLFSFCIRLPYAVIYIFRNESVQYSQSLKEKAESETAAGPLFRGHFGEKNMKNWKTKSSKEQKRINMARSAGSSKWTFSVVTWQKTERWLLVNVCLVDFEGKSCVVLLSGAKLD